MIEQKVFNGDNLELLKQYPDNYFDSIVTDPPYGLGKEPNAEQMLQAWITNGYLEISGSGFMGKEWDAFVPQPLFWKEAFRVLKHGGHVVSFFGTRTYDWGVMAMRLAGFEVRDCIQWIYGSGFPKSHNISKAIDKMYGAEREVIGKAKAGGKDRNGYVGDMAIMPFETKSIELDITAPSTEQAKQWDGWGSALKPANEPIVLARKPLENGLSIAENVLKWGTGGINIDGCRIEGIKGVPSSLSNKRQMDWIVSKNLEKKQVQNGRFPANLILTHHPDCVCLGTKKVRGSNCSPSDIGKGNEENMFGFSGKITASHTDENGEETIENWNCHEDCPIKIMDEQSGDRKGWASQNHTNFSPYGGNALNPSETNRVGFHKGYDDKGGASRFFYCAKASKSERNKGLDSFEEKQSVGGGGGIGDYIEDVNSASGKYGSEKAPNKNFHPTVKPVALMRYLVRLITPPNGIVLDPFNGSGTTGIACKLEGMNYVGLELDAEYCKIAQARIDNFVWEDEEVEFTDEQNDTTKSNDSQLNLFD